MINPPEARSYAVGAMQQEPVVRDGEIVARHTIALELSVDHRAVDGAVGAAFLKDLARSAGVPDADRAVAHIPCRARPAFRGAGSATCSEPTRPCLCFAVRRRAPPASTLPHVRTGRRGLAVHHPNEVALSTGW